MFEVPAGFEMVDDLDVALDPTEYRDQALPMPIFAGNYAVRVVKTGLKTEYENPGQVVLVKNEAGEAVYPIVVINELSVAKPEDLDGRKIFPMGFGQEFGTKPFTGKDFVTKEPYPRNYLAEILRSHDASLSFRGTRAGMQLFERIVNEGGLFHVRIDWVAEDRAYVKEQIKQILAARDDGQVSQDEANKLIKAARYVDGRLEGMNKFVDPTTGKLNPTWTGPSGEDVEAKAFIRQWISVADLERYKLGPQKVRVPKLSIN
jgi:hypothetical protein